jgi:hypothetical protein
MTCSLFASVACIHQSRTAQCHDVLVRESSHYYFSPLLIKKHTNETSSLTQVGSLLLVNNPRTVSAKLKGRSLVTECCCAGLKQNGNLETSNVLTTLSGRTTLTALLTDLLTKWCVIEQESFLKGYCHPSGEERFRIWLPNFCLVH